MEKNMLVTKKEFQKEASWVREEFGHVRKEMREEFGKTRQEMNQLKEDLNKMFGHHVGILVEAFRDQVQLVSEYATSVEERLDRKIDTVHLELKQDINLTRLMVSATRDELKYEIGELRNEVRSLKKA